MENKFFDKIVSYNTDISGAIISQLEFLSIFLVKAYEKNKSILIVTPSLYEANKLYNSIINYNDALLFQVDDVILHNSISSPELRTERINTLNELVKNDKKIVITDVNGYLSFLPDTFNFSSSFISLSVGDYIDIKNLATDLINNGYEKTDIVTNTGEIGVRGFVLDVFPVSFDNPIRIETEFDKIVSIKSFDYNTQKSFSSLNNISISPNSLLSSGKNVSIYNYMPNSTVIFKDYSQCHIAYERIVEDNIIYNNNNKIFFDFEEINPIKKIMIMDFDSEFNEKKEKFIDYKVLSVPSFNEDINKINSYVNKNKKDKTIILVLNKINNSFLEELDFSFVISDFENIIDNTINIVQYTMSYGFEVNGYILLTDYELFNRKKEINRKAHFKFGSRIKDITNLEIGDYVVHALYGIGIYNGIKAISKSGILGDYIEILYDGDDKLYIPASKIDLISKYSGKDGYRPKINALNGISWAKTKEKVREKIKYEAARLLKIQAERKLKQGFAFSKDTPLQTLFDASFKYEETDDQIKAIKQIKEDMENIQPMDRILCGDVGYGKTEVAFRAMFKAVQDSKQVLYLCPTTLLCKQQYEAAMERFRDFPVNIAMFSRFTSSRDAEKIISGLKNGSIDICFGTHKLLNDQIRPKDLGLLVIDEEQRFGVAHKEKIKELKSNIDILTLTATPIPRTLQLAMLGLKNLSLIETPPKNRHAVQTYVTPYDKKLVRDIIYKEISRNGQVFILYNDVQSIESKKAEFERLVPDARIIVAHGQMSKTDLEDRMNTFISGNADILLCTTIIETGIDIPNANSLIIINADRFGLAQLYQIRGRVGRSDRIAYTYLMYNRGKLLNEIAMKRLKVIKEFTALGSGFSIATRDLSIRGAGDILGAEQAGFIDSVGIDLYMQMLESEVNKLKGVEVKENKNSSNKPLIDVESHISDNYVDNDDLKIEIHKMITTIDSNEKLLKVKEELEDRFGKIDDNMFIYMNEQLFEHLVIKKDIENVNNSNLYIELVVSENKSNKINYEDLFINSLKISNKFTFNYKNNKFYIRLSLTNLKDNPILILNKLLYEM